jgi:allantoate deiminase
LVGDSDGSGAEIVARCRRLARISEDEERLTRPFATPAMLRANELVGSWMTAAGGSVRGDVAGNLIGTWRGTSDRNGTLLLGSHLDTVRDAGAFDGPLGVVVAIAAMQRLREQDAELPFDVDVIGFSDEEGLRFGTAYLGSGAVAGELKRSMLDHRDADGVRIGEALRAFGGDPDQIQRASRRDDRLLGYIEVHIEQGPVLEQLGQPLGVVTAISGATRLGVTFIGRPGHAGTVPMSQRRDALATAAGWMLTVEELARSGDGLVATVGQIEAFPGAPNVVPGRVTLTLDVRHADDHERERAVRMMRERAIEQASLRNVTVEFEELLSTPTVAVDDQLTDRLRAALAQRGLTPVELPSGAGHDAVMLARITPVAMLFVRCAEGLSHHPDESVEPEDAGAAVDVLTDVLRAMADGG